MQAMLQKAYEATQPAPTPEEPAPVEPTPEEPAPVEPTPVEPTPVEPAPVEPTPEEPTPVEPAPEEPAPEDTTEVGAQQPDVPLASDEQIVGTRVGMDGTLRTTIERTNPNDPSQSITYEQVYDPETGDTYYEQGGFGVDEDGNPTSGGTTVSDSKPSWSWETPADTGSGLPDESDPVDELTPEELDDILNGGGTDTPTPEEPTDQGPGTGTPVEPTPEEPTPVEPTPETPPSWVSNGDGTYTHTDADGSTTVDSSGNMAAMEGRLQEAIAANEAAGLSRDQAISKAVDDVAASVGTTRTDLLTQLGDTEQSILAKFQAGQDQTTKQIGDLSADMQAKYDALTQGQKTLADQLIQQGVDTATAISNAQASTDQKIGDLTADVQAKYDALTQGQKDLANQLIQQGVDTSTAIATAQSQTEQKVADLGTELNGRINQLMQQGQTYQQATEQAFAEVNSKNAELSGLLGTQGRTANQTDIDALTKMLNGEAAVDLNYDTNNDGKITQDDINFLTGVVNGGNTSTWRPTTGPWASTGLYGQVQKNEWQRQDDAAKAQQDFEKAQADQLAREQKAQADQIAREREAARLSAIRTTAGQAQTQIQGIKSQLPAAIQATQETSTPIYAGEIKDFDFGSPLDVGFFGLRKEAQNGQNKGQTAKIATGGYLDDLLDLLR